MLHDDDCVIRIKQDGEIWVEQFDNQIKSLKKISSDTFVNCIRNSLRTGMINSGVLPKGCISYSKGDDKNEYVCMEFEERYCDIVYEKTKYEHFPIPRLVFGFMMCEGKIRSIRLGVTETGILSPKSRMYQYPFSNVSRFELCIGSNSMPDIKSLHQLNGLMYYIMSMPNNNDHYHPGNSKLSMEYRELLEHLKDKEPSYYYSDVLIESNKTLKDFVTY